MEWEWWERFLFEESKRGNDFGMATWAIRWNERSTDERSGRLKTKVEL
jgi:hypothetical protein